MIFTYIAYESCLYAKNRNLKKNENKNIHLNEGKYNSLKKKC